MGNTVKERLIEFLHYKRISQSRFEKLCGMSNGYVNNLKKMLGAEKMQNIIRAFPELNTDWLLSGDGEMLKSSVITVTGDNNVTGGNNVSVEGNNSNDNVRVSTMDKAINELSEMRKLLQEQIKNNQELINNNKEQFDRLVSIIEKLTNK